MCLGGRHSELHSLLTVTVLPPAGKPGKAEVGHAKCLGAPGTSFEEVQKGREGAQELPTEPIVEHRIILKSRIYHGRKYH